MSVYTQRFSSFLYGFEITDENNYFDIDEGDGSISVSINPGNYSLSQFIAAVEEALNSSGSHTYTVTVNRTNRIITIACVDPTDFLFATGTHAGQLADVAGFASTDHLAATSVSGDNEVGTLYTPQFKLQSFVPSANNEEAAFATKNVSASGRVQVQKFGIQSFMECEIMFATNISQPDGAPITDNPTGIEELRAFLSALCRQVPVEFYVDKDDVNTYENMILESTDSSKDGTGYQLKEMRNWVLRGYFQTGKLTFRVVT